MRRAGRCFFVHRLLWGLGTDCSFHSHAYSLLVFFLDCEFPNKTPCQLDGPADRTAQRTERMTTGRDAIGRDRVQCARAVFACTVCASGCTYEAIGWGTVLDAELRTALGTVLGKAPSTALHCMHVRMRVSVRAHI